MSNFMEELVRALNMLFLGKRTKKGNRPKPKPSTPTNKGIPSIVNSELKIDNKKVILKINQLILQ